MDNNKCSFVDSITYVHVLQLLINFSFEIADWFILLLLNMIFRPVVVHLELSGYDHLVQEEKIQ